MGSAIAVASLVNSLFGGIKDYYKSKSDASVSSDALKEKFMELDLAKEQILANSEIQQMAINLAEANNINRKWPTWRESLGYVCVFAVAYHFVIQQFMAFLLSAGSIQVKLPDIEISGLMAILSAMLGVHLVDSRYNSPQGGMPKESAPTAARKGRLINDPEQGVIWNED